MKKAIELIEDGKIEDEGRKARKFVERYSWDNITDEFEQILEKAMEDKRNGTTSKRV